MNKKDEYNQIQAKAGKEQAVTSTSEYRELINRLTRHVQQAQNRAARAINSELVILYWTIGKEIIEQQEISGWGDDVIGKIAEDLKNSTGSTRGFSRRNLFYMKQFAQIYPNIQFVPAVLAQIGWTHLRILIDRYQENQTLFEWYALRASENGWSYRYLEGQIDLKLHERQGKAITNFSTSLEPDDQDSALEAVKDPYVFDFLELGKQYNERQLEQALLDDIQKFLLELGSGFAFYGRQKSLVVEGKEFFLDLIFYHHTLRRFIIIELKTGEFQPEFVGKMNFYLNAVDRYLCVEGDKESIGIILCTNAEHTFAEIALDRILAPIAVSTWQGKSSEHVPEELQELNDVKERLVEQVTRTRLEIEKRTVE